MIKTLIIPTSCFVYLFRLIPPLNVSILFLPSVGSSRYVCFGWHCLPLVSVFLRCDVVSYLSYQFSRIGSLYCLLG